MWRLCWFVICGRITFVCLLALTVNSIGDLKYELMLGIMNLTHYFCCWLKNGSHLNDTSQKDNIGMKTKVCKVAYLCSPILLWGCFVLLSILPYISVLSFPRYLQKLAELISLAEYSGVCNRLTRRCLRYFCSTSHDPKKGQILSAPLL